MAVDEKEYKHQWYLANRDRILLRQKEINARVRREKQDFLRGLKSNTPCADCGQKFHYAVMDFDHVRGVKIDNLGTMISRNSPWQVIKAEVAKCDIVCANCHRMRTWNRMGV